jgi:methylenetetrahydrofolate dehydrogenase (NADP+)/methenyltetrahydrofolate cyclohydrolase
MAQILDGKALAEEILTDVRHRAEALAKRGIKPGLATVLVGDDPASHVYVGQKIKKCEANGLASIHRPLPGNVSQADLEKTVKELNADPKVHGIIVQLPVPKHLDPEPVLLILDPKKDADGLHPFNQGLVGRMKSWDEIKKSGVPLPCTPAGVIELFAKSGVSAEGKHAVVVGRSTLVGKPVFQFLLSLNATVTMAHSKTKNLPEVCRSADILVAALGIPHAIKKDFVKPGAVVLDVGISRTPEGIRGDVDFANVKDVASWITPVPGGVGPMTVAMLLRNTILAAEYASR